MTVIWKTSHLFSAKKQRDSVPQGPKIVPGENICRLFPRASDRRVLLIVEVCKNTSSYVHIFVTSSSHLHHIFIASSSHLLIFSIFSSSHLLIFTSSHLHIFSLSLLLSPSSHLHIFSSSRSLSPSLSLFTSSHLLIFSLSPSLSLSLSFSLCLSCPLSRSLSFFFFSLLRPREMRFECQKLRVFCECGWSGGNHFARNEVRVSKADGKSICVQKCLCVKGLCVKAFVCKRVCV